jgi:prepilin-type N-terminal cleavage/methylation domain-containing protein
VTAKRLGNKGFSLLELLIGITMLAIIVVPILHAFLTSSKTSGKAKEVRNETIAAQNIIEAYAAADIVTILSNPSKMLSALGDTAAIARLEQLVIGQDSISRYEQVTDYGSAAKDGPGYRLYLTGVATGGKTYDAVLNIDASKYSNRNSAGIVDYKPMDAVYVQPGPGDDSNPDDIAAKNFASQARIDSGLDILDNYFADKMTRKVTITIEKIGGPSGIISCTALYKYATPFTYALPDNSTDPPEGSTEPPEDSPEPQTVTKHYSLSINNDFYSGSYTEGGNNLYGLYFFFYPNATVGAAYLYDNVPGDTIEIVNRNNIDMSVYLIRLTSDAGANNPAIFLREQYDPTTQPPHAQMYYKRDLPSYKYYIGYPDSGGFSDYWFKTIPFNGNLVGTEAQNRLYGVTVDLYKAGSIHADGSITGTPLATFEASSME